MKRFLYAPEGIWRLSRAGLARPGISLAQALAYRPPLVAGAKGGRLSPRVTRVCGKTFGLMTPWSGLSLTSISKYAWTREFLGC